MTDTTILHDRLLSKLREAVTAVVDIDGAEEKAIEIAATALTDMLANVLARLPAALDPEGATTISLAMGNRMMRRMMLEAMDRGELFDLRGAPSQGGRNSAIGSAEKITDRPTRKPRGKG
ncbi:hypothetical protein [Sphingobium fuliginis]|uniref:Uncharacterized protein n=1 Tax=Sphingobium fuliginis (strain ATCC 27551) TaxID=336203 RepID=A0ABQ1ESV5_SPHSA|nr:hypothetical protein [Sphingobium fuliginis]GFZ85152.1 hypothetical protein GCM10019071_12720 [Sphingobium fuliginis]